MEQFCNWQSGMWIFPLVGCSFMMFCCIMMFFGWRRFGGSSFCSPQNRHWDYDRNTKEHNRPETAKEILDRRYANGEISKEEYDRIKRDILT